MWPDFRLSTRADGTIFISIDDSPPTSPSHYPPNQRSLQGNSKIFDPSFALPQVLVGGEAGIETIHWIKDDDIDGDKVDEKAAERLWEGWTLIDGVGLEVKIEEDEMQVTMSLEAALEDPKQMMMHYTRAVSFHEKITRSYLLHAAEFIEIALGIVGKGKIGPSVLERLSRNREKDGGSIVGLTKSVARAEALKSKGNVAGKAGGHDTAIRHYLDALLALWPWTAGVAMTFEQASESGLVKCEQAILLNIANIALVARPKTGGKRRAWDGIIRVACEVVLQMRYATYGSLTKAFDRLARVEDEQSDESGNGSTTNGGDQGVYQLMAGMFEGKPADQWAHKFCVRGHVCHD